MATQYTSGGPASGGVLYTPNTPAPSAPSGNTGSSGNSGNSGASATPAYPGGYVDSFGNTLSAPGVTQDPLAPSAGTWQPPVNTAQPNPNTVNATPYTDPNLKQAFTNTMASGVEAPQGAGDASSAVSQAVNQVAQTPTFYKPDQNSQQVFNAKGEAVSHDQYLAQGGKEDYSNVQNAPIPVPNATPLQGIEAQLSQDKGYQQLLKDYADYNSITEKSKSLVDTYNEIVKSSGLEAINTEMINMKNVIDGTEDDIRNEVTAASGFATDSQVLALAQARNKTLIKSYNKLVDQQSNITNQVNTMVNLAGQDRQFALQSISQKLQIDQQISDYRDKFISNAREGYNNYIKAVGYSGLYGSLKNDPQSLAIAEQTLGLPAGTIAQAAQQEAHDQAQKDQAFNLDSQLKQSQLKTDAVQRANIASEIANRGSSNNTSQVVDTGSGKVLLTYDKQGNIIKTSPITNDQPIAGPMQLAQAKSQVDQITGLAKEKNLSTVVGPNMFSRASTGLFSGIVGSLGGGGYLRNLVTPGRSNAIADIEQLRSQLTLDSLVNAKQRGATFGALSDAEGNLLSQSATKIGSWAIKGKDGKVIGYNATEADFKNELNKIGNFAKLDYVLKGGDANEIGVQLHDDGSAWTKNSDGSMTRIYP